MISGVRRVHFGRIISALISLAMPTGSWIGFEYMNPLLADGIFLKAEDRASVWRDTNTKLLHLLWRTASQIVSTPFCSFSSMKILRFPLTALIASINVGIFSLSPASNFFRSSIV